MEHTSPLNALQESKPKQPKEPGLFNTFIEDIRCALHRDPAARNWFEVLINYAGLHAVWAYRISHWLWKNKLFLPARWLAQTARWFTGIEIHPGATIGYRLFIDHGMGVVIGETADVGDDVTLYHGVTLGGVSLEKGKRHPTLGNCVVVGAGAKVLGAIEIGAGSRIGANAVVVKSVPPDSVVVGIPGQIIKRSHQDAPELIDLHHDRLPDTIGDALRQVMSRLDRLEDQMHLHENGHIEADEEGHWIGKDFSI